MYELDPAQLLTALIDGSERGMGGGRAGNEERKKKKADGYKRWRGVSRCKGEQRQLTPRAVERC